MEIKNTFFHLHTLPDVTNIVDRGVLRDVW